MSNYSQNPFAPVKKPTQPKSPASFLEALKNIGGSAVKSVSQDVLANTAKDFVTSLTGGVAKSQTEYSPKEWNNDPESAIREEAWKLQRHKEIVEQPVFDRKKIETEERIKVIQEELKLLAQELVGLDLTIEKAIKEDVVNPGVYHVNFFSQLRKAIIEFRNRVSDSSAWLETMTSRAGAKGSYWGNVAKSGTKYMMSDERKVATSAG